MEVADFNALPATAAGDVLRPVCASRTWIDALVEQRPYPGADAALLQSDSVLTGLSWADVEQALTAHPRIGERAAGAQTEARWSREEQSAAAADVDTQAALHAANVDYERRFGFVFLVCATGLSSTEVLAALHERLGHDVDTEQYVVRHELAAIARLRLGRILS